MTCGRRVRPLSIPVANGVHCLLWGAGFAGDEAFDEAQLEPLDTFDVESGRADLGEWAAQEVLAAQWDGDGFQDSLHHTRGPRGAFDVIDEDEPSTGSQDSGHLEDGHGGVGDRAQPEGADDGIEAGVVERERVSVALQQGGGAPKLAGPG